MIGGGDFAPDRLLPDAYRAFVAGAPLRLRRPDAVRPWQHVLDPLHGYLRSPKRSRSTALDGGAYNFGPGMTASVREVAERFVRAMGGNPASAIVVEPSDEHETAVLEVDSARAQSELGWTPRWSPSAAVELAAAWYRDFIAGARVEHLVARDLDAFAR